MVFLYKDVEFLCVGYGCHLLIYIILIVLTHIYTTPRNFFFVVTNLLSIFHIIKHFNDNSITTVTKMSVSLNSTIYPLILG